MGLQNGLKSFPIDSDIKPHSDRRSDYSELVS